MSVPDDEEENQPKLVYLPNTALLGCLVTVLSWMLTISSFYGGVHASKRIVCFAISALASVFLITVGRKAMASVSDGNWWPVKPDEQIALTKWQVLWTTIIILAASLTYTWLEHE